MKEIATEHGAIDRFVESVFRANGVRPCCRAGCSACCSEAVYASEAEVLHIIESLSAERIEELKLKLREWLDKTQPIMHRDMPDAVEYRRLNAPCVFLKGGLCSIYPYRPHGCRVWFAKSDPENCDLPHREHQQFIIFSDAIFDAIGTVTCVDDKHVLDHLGNLLAEKLLGIKVKSGSRTENSAQDFRSARSAP